MPYIPVEQRAMFRPIAEAPDKAGQLNYQITMLLLQYLKQHGLSYDTVNACGGALDYAGKEFYRRVVVPFEEEKRAQNGDVYGRD
jgi:hypothetical protein